MAEIQNKITYADFYGNDTTSVFAYVSSMLYKVYEYMQGLTSVSVTWSNNDTNTAMLHVSKAGYDTNYFFEATTDGISSGQCKLSLDLNTTNGIESLHSTTYSLANWRKYGLRFLYLSTSDVFIFDILNITGGNPSTTFNGNSWGMFVSLENGTNLYHYSGYNFYNILGTSISISTSNNNYGDVDKVILANVYIGNSKLNGVNLLSASRSSGLYQSTYVDIEGYGRYYAMYTSGTSPAPLIGVKLGD